MIAATSGKLHWNYYLALERDLEQVSRFVEFAPQNFQVYSIELAHLLFAAASEVDVVAKLVCQQVDAVAPRRNIDDYRAAIIPSIPTLPTEEVIVPRYGLILRPWENWSTGKNPDWWRSYNSVKHERDAHFHEATLQNALNALAGLLIVTFHYYRGLQPGVGIGPPPSKDVTRELQPEPSLMRLPNDYYYENLIVG